MKYKIYATYSFERYCGQIEADNSEQACELAYENGLVPEDVALCYECEQGMRDHPSLHSDDYIYAEECEEN